MKRVLGCGATSLLLLAGVVALLLWAIVIYQDLVRAEIDLESSWTGIENLCRLRADLVPDLLYASAGGAAPSASLAALERAARQARQMVLTPELLSREADFRSFERAQTTLARRIDDVLAEADASDPALDRLRARFEDCNERWRQETARFNARAAEFNAARTAVPAAWVARLFGFSVKPTFDPERIREVGDL